jgi:hypothetical protein
VTFTPLLLRVHQGLRNRRGSEAVRLDEDLLLRVPEFPDDCLGGTTMGGEENIGNLRR